MKIFKLLSVFIVLLIPNTNIFSEELVPLNTYSMNLLNSIPAIANFSFAVISDIHYSKLNDVGTNNNGSNFRKLMDDICNSSDKPSFIILTGDICGYYGVETDYENFYNDYMGNNQYNKIPLFCIPGNHDFYQEPSNPSANILSFYNKYIGINTNFYFDYGNSRFILVDNRMNNNNNNYTTYPYQWYIPSSTIINITSWVSNAPLFKFGFAHIPLFLTQNEGSYQSMGLTNLGYQNLHNIYVNNDFISSFSGHVHIFADLSKDGLNYTIAGGGNIKPLSISSFPNLDGCLFWVKITVDLSKGIIRKVNLLEGKWNNDLETEHYLAVIGNDITISSLDPDQFNYFSSNSITVKNIVFNDGNKRVMFANNSIKFQTGFKVQNNSRFKAKIISPFAQLKSTDAISKSKFPDALLIEEPKNMFFKLLPNPNNGNFNLEMINLVGYKKIWVYNSMGQSVYENETSNANLKIEMSNKPKGLYNLLICNSGNYLKAKFILQ